MSLIHQPSIQPIPGRMPAPLLSPTDKVIYANIGLGLNLKQYQKAIEDEGYTWTPEVHHRVDMLAQLIHNNLGIGITKERLRQAYETSGTGRKFSQDFMYAFDRSEMGYFRVEILSLQAKHPEWSRATLLDELKGGRTIGEGFVRDVERSNLRRGSLRLFSTDTTLNAFNHRYNDLREQHNWENVSPNTHIYGGVLYEIPSSTRTPYSNHGITPSTIELVNQATFTSSAPQPQTNSAFCQPTAYTESMHPSTVLQEGLEPTRISTATTVFGHDSMDFSDYEVAQNPGNYQNSPHPTGLKLSSLNPCLGSSDDSGNSVPIETIRIKPYGYHLKQQEDSVTHHTDAPIDLSGYSSLSHPTWDGQYVSQEDNFGTNQGPVKRKSSNSEGMAAELKRPTQKLYGQLASAEDDQSEIVELKQQIEYLVHCSRADELLIDHLKQKVSRLEIGAALLQSELDASLKKRFEEAHKNAMLDLGPRFQSFRINATSSAPMQNSDKLDEPPAKAEQPSSPESASAATGQDSKWRKILRKKRSGKLRGAKSVLDFNDYMSKSIASIPMVPAQQNSFQTNAYFDGMS